MVKTKNNKPLIGKDFIQNLAVDQDCKSFTQGKKVMLCKCCSKFANILDLVKDVFHALHKEFWDLECPSNIPNKEKAAFEGRKLAIFLEKYCTFLSKHKPMYEFPLPNSKGIISVCLPTMIRVFGLPKTSFFVVQREHTHDTKRIGLTMLKYFSKNFTTKANMKQFYYRFRNWFPQPVMPLSPDNVQAVKIIEKNLRGKMLRLSKSILASIQVIYEKHLTKINKMQQVSHGGENIWFGPPSKMEDWNGLNKKKTRALHDGLTKTIKLLWKDSPQAIKNFQYKMTCLFSKLSPENPNGIPQVGHTDYTEASVLETEMEVGVKPCIGFTPMHEDGCMLLIFPQKYKKGKPIPNEKPEQYYLYIPYGLALILPGHVVHAGGFCFGQSTKSNEASPKNISQFTNHHLHFFLCPDKRSFDEANKDENEVYLEEDNTGVVSYSEKSKADSYKPDEKVFNKLHHSLLQDFVPEDVNISNDSEEEEDDKPQEKVKGRKKKSKDVKKKAKVVKKKAKVVKKKVKFGKKKTKVTKK